jgi:thiamine-phosphate pyrophosphorylase
MILLPQLHSFGPIKYYPSLIFSSMKKNNENEAVLRIIDANLNRLREALRVVEEYFRFVDLSETTAIELKQARHSLEEIEKEYGPENLLSSRDVSTDPFASVNRPEETGRVSADEIVRGNFKRAQEASRVIEEYAKITEPAYLSERAKKIRFTLYTLEKLYGENIGHE